MTKNKLSDLNDHLFAQLERLGEEGLEGEKLQNEISRSEAVAALSEQVVANADLQLRAAKLMIEHGGAGGAKVKDMLPMLDVKDPMKEGLNGKRFDDPDQTVTPPKPAAAAPASEVAPTVPGGGGGQG